MKNKDNKKGLTDEELIKKYEAGEQDLDKALKKMIKPNKIANKGTKENDLKTLK